MRKTPPRTSILWLVAVLLASSYSTLFSQTKPETPKNDSTAQCINATNIRFKGFYLGMPTSEVLRRLGMSAKQITPLVLTRTDKWGTEMEADVGHSKLLFHDARNVYPDLHGINFKLFNGKVYHILVLYNGTIEWKNMVEYTENLGKAFNLPADKWDYFDVPDAPFDVEYDKAANFYFCNSIRLTTGLQKKRRSASFEGGYQKDFHSNDLMYFWQMASVEDDTTSRLIESRADDEFRRLELEREKKNGAKKRDFKP